MNRVFNSLLEIKLRVLLVLDEATIFPLSQDAILAIDFMSVYGKEFGISEFNLHGDNSYKFSELASRKELIDKSIKELVLDGLLDVDTSKGYRYQINDAGSNFVAELDNEYAEEYRKTVSVFFDKYSNFDTGKLFKIIREKSLANSMEGDK